MGGLTGRKIIIDTYGGWGAHGGGAFSGKDPSKVDRSAAYYTRWIAKSLVAAKLCSRVLVQVSYAIGVAAPLSVNVDCYGTNTRGEPEILDIVHANFDMRKPKYAKTACYGHFGNSARAADPDFTWEIPKKLNFGAAKTQPAGAGGAALPGALSERVITNLLDQIDSLQ